MSSRQHYLAFFLLALLAGPPAASADPLYAVTFLPQDFYAAGINNGGQIVGTAGGGAAIWSSPTSITSLGALLPGSEGLGINNHGDIVGRYGDNAFVYAGGVATSIVTDYRSWATGINDAGQVTGTAATGGLGGVQQSGFLYAGGTTTLFSPDFLGNRNAANAINDAGLVVGTMTTGGGHWSDPDREVFTYSLPDGIPRGRGTLGGAISEGEDINDAGAFVGWSTNYEGNEELALMFSPQTGVQSLGSLGGTSSRAHGLNNLGWVVGMSDAGAGDGFDYHAFLYREHGMVDLNSLVAPLDGWSLVTAEDVNDAGQILAQACRGTSGECQFVRLDLLAPIPEPSTWAMLLAGLCLVGLAGRRARAGLAVGAVPALLAAPFAAHAGTPPAFTMTTVPTGFTAAAINNVGQIVGTWQAGASQAAAIWNGTTITTLAGLAPDSQGQGINDLGHIVGTWHAQAFIGTRAGVRDLGRFGYWGSSNAVAVNAADDVAGTAYWGIGEEWRGWVYTHGVLRMIGTFGGDWSEARAINKTGQVVGTAALVPFRSPYGDTRAFVYRDRMLQDLGTLGDGISSRANDINDMGQIVGASEYAYNDSSGPMHPFLYQNRIMRDLGTLGGPDGAANGINNAGAVVGYSTLAEGFTTHAFLYENGRIRDLNTLTRVTPGWVLVDASDINDRRQILARACRDENCVMVRLDPVEPAP
jgi:probable HAF family extracellular repeat protein